TPESLVCKGFQSGRARKKAHGFTSPGEWCRPDTTTRYAPNGTPGPDRPGVTHRIVFEGGIVSARPKCPRCKRTLNDDDESDFECWTDGRRDGEDGDFFREPFRCSKCRDAEITAEVAQTIAGERGTTEAEVRELMARGREYVRQNGTSTNLRSPGGLGRKTVLLLETIFESM